MGDNKLTLTSQEAADLLRVSRRRVLQMIRDGLLPATYTGEGMRKTYYIRRADVEALARQERKAGRPRKNERPSGG